MPGIQHIEMDLNSRSTPNIIKLQQLEVPNNCYMAHSHYCNIEIPALYYTKL